MGRLAPGDVKEDLTLLPTPTDESILANIKDRYSRNLIFNRIGAGALVVVNPVKTLESFSDSTCTQYADWAKDTAEDKVPLPAHIFDLAVSVFNHMWRNQQDQSVVFSGDSGSGKTEARKLLVRQLIALSTNAKKKSKVHSGILKTETILDAFGTARTLLNPSSSRFGRYTEYQYDSHGRMVGAKMLDYLLEKDRVSATPADERNFHIFYYLLAGATIEEKTQWRLQDATHYAYLKGSRPVRLTTEDQIKFGELRDHLKSLGVGRRLQAQIYQLLAAVLHLGNIEFQEDVEKPKESCVVKNAEALEIAAELLGVAAKNLESSLTVRTKLVWRDVVSVFMNAEEATKQRNQLANTLYGLVFAWLVEHINTRLCKDECDTFIGVVDMSGFQDTENNGMEQLLANYANERLQQFVNKAVASPHEEYVKEGIRSVSVPQTDNTATVNFLNTALGVIDAATGDHAQEKPLLDRLTQKVGTDEHFVAGKTESTFGVQHSSRVVEYQTASLVEKNKDVVCADFVAIFRGNGKDIPSSANGFVRNLFSEGAVATESAGRDRAMITGATPKKPSRHPSLKRNNSQYGGYDRANRDTVAYNFRTSVDEMIETLGETIPWFVFCVKPNDDLSTDKFESKKVKAQLRRFGITQIAQARAGASYSAHYEINDFLARYRVIIDPMGLDDSGGPSGKCEDFVLHSNWTNRDMAVGRSKVFLSEASWRSLEDELRTIEDQLKADRKARKSDKSRGGSGSQDDTASMYSSEYEYGDDVSMFDDGESHYHSEYEYNGGLSHQHSQVTLVGREKRSTEKDLEAGQKANEALIEEEDHVTSARRKWVCCTWFLTWWIPPFCLSICGGMKRKDIQMAWREKVALCLIIFFCCCALVFFIIGLGRLICPRLDVLSTSEIAGRKDAKDPYVYAYGHAYMIKDVVDTHITTYGRQNYELASFYGTDVSNLFNKAALFSNYCPGIDAPSPGWSNLAITQRNSPALYNHSQVIPGTNGRVQDYFGYMNQYARKRVAWAVDDVASQANLRNLVIINDNIYDLSAYFDARSGGLFNDQGMNTIVSMKGKDATSQWNSLIAKPDPAKAKRYVQCMNGLFYVGVVDHRNDFVCRFSNYILLASTIVLVVVIGFKFLAALQFGGWKEPEDHDKFVICQVPCYTEGAESLTKTLESLATLRYDDKRKLIVVLCDGNIIGSGNDRPTPRIVLDILGVDPNHDPEPVSFQSLGEGDKQHNMAKVYSGLYEVQGHSVPYIVVVKVGKPSERNRPGNRGKRDSQMILMRFLNRVHFNLEMNPLELELYHHMKNIIGVNPSFYEYTLMVDADTEVYKDSLNRMVSAMIHDSKIMGICGETLIDNEKESLTTMIQVYEYFISHHLSKAFESLFGSVTCLPGCFCMYRIRTPVKNIPLLISPSVIEDYSENRVDTLHKKNLLHLGEDRYLTTLMMKHFPNHKLSFTNDAQCRTNAPDRWSVLLSQRRRWINSTVHNLFELIHLQQLCGFCCFSMRFIVMIDLFSTLVQPVILLYIGYLVYSAITEPDIFPMMSVIMLAAIYGLQVLIFILKRQWAQIGWMIVYILAMPVFSFWIPLYSFWHFDDFSWGNTRVVVGDKGKKMVYASDVQPFNPKSIPMKKWADHESETWEKGSSGSQGSKHSGSSHSRRAPSVASGYSPSAYEAQSLYNGSVYGAQPAPSVYSGYGAPSAYAASAYGGAYQRPAAPPARNSLLSLGAAPAYVASAGGYPTDDDILRETRRILATANLMTVTKKQVRDELSSMFGTDLNSRKATVNGFIEDILQGRL
ncbi:chitin synthase-domain-containing protein [Fimicolochytrium jonesii]|uniref:chitin synthase-domain-containing protein n=1 Tax=Fimicolochytrium jonesii TaxID=1396493 RepID=UPI0022FE5390|nr:chitin synthase-domain-containing protein [Fimicolochytrium jonesii]KAI8818378.1 chitin synthase-domain-containing protein [Fimicolochytrium jonesii]